MNDWDGKERRTNGVETIVNELKQTIAHHINSDDAKFSMMIDKMHDIDTNVSKMIVLSTETLKSQMTLVASNQQMTMKHNEFIYGNSNGEKGISVRIDRLEGAEESRKWTFRVMWAAIISLLTKVFYDLIKR